MERLTTLIKAVDVSVWQKPDLSVLGGWISQGAQALVVHAYHDGERPELKQSTRDWIAVARQAGCWSLPYVWLFRSLSAADQTRQAIELFRESDAAPKLIALDCENYVVDGAAIADPGPTAEQILEACEQARSMGVEPMVYSGKDWLDHMDGDHEILVGVPAWIANWNGVPDLEVPAPTWVRVVGHQYKRLPVDWSVFDLEALTELQSGQSGQDPVKQLKAAILVEAERIKASSAALADLAGRVELLCR